MKAISQYDSQQLIAIGNMRERIEMAKVRSCPYAKSSTRWWPTRYWTIRRMREFGRTNDTELLELVIFHREAIVNRELGAETAARYRRELSSNEVFEALLINEMPGTTEATAQDREPLFEL